MSLAMKIYKYEISPTGKRMALPAGAELLTVGIQGSEAVLWARVSPDATKVVRRIVAIPTGAEAPEGYRYVGTFHMRELVFHVFDGGEVPLSYSEFA